MSGIPINSGTGPSVAATVSGTDYIQIVNVAAGSVNITNSPTMTVGNVVTITGTVGSLMLQRLDNVNDSILIYGAQTGSTVNQPILVSTTGGLYIASGGGGGSQYGLGTTAAGNTGTGTFILGLQTGSTAAQGIAVTTTGYQYVLFGATQPVTAGIVTTTASIAVIGTAHASRFQAFAVATTSAAAGVIVKTSGASTLYITDVLVAVPTPNNVGLYSETTGPLAFAYLAANGGFQMNLVQPLVCTTAQSLRVILSSSGSASVTVIGYTVT